MRTNFHTHTFRCQHAQGTEVEMIEAAIANGYSDLGFSDHTPWPFADGYVSGIRMRADQLEDYVTVLRKLKARYAKQINLHIGLEAEYFPGFVNYMRDIQAQYGLYFIMGNHFDTIEPGTYFGSVSDRKGLFHYLDMVTAGLETGLYTYLAHPDVCVRSFPRFDRDCEEVCRELCRACKALHIPMEYNVLGARVQLSDQARGNIGYTRPEFWEIAAQEQVDCIVGVDAHTPTHLKDPEVYDRSAAYLRYLGLNLLTGLELDPFKA